MENHLGEGVSSVFTLCSTSAYLRHWEEHVLGNNAWQLRGSSELPLNPYWGHSAFLVPLACGSQTHKYSGAPPFQWEGWVGGSGCTASGRGGCLGTWMSLRITEGRGTPRAVPGKPFSITRSQARLLPCTSHWHGYREMSEVRVWCQQRFSPCPGDLAAWAPCTEVIYCAYRAKQR